MCSRFPFCNVALAARTPVRRAGATLVDLSMAVLVIGILAAVATPKFFGALESNRAAAAARKIAADLQYARQRAIAGSSEQVVRFTTATSTYSMDGITNPARPGQSWSVVLTASPWSASIDSVGFGSAGVLRFNLHGVPNAGGTLVVRSGSVQRSVSVDAVTGKVSVL